MGGDELGAEFREHVAGEEAVGLAGEEVVAGVVGGVAAEAKRVGLDEERARGFADFLDGGGERPGGGGDVEGGVEGEAFDAVAGGAAPEFGVGRELFRGGRGVGVAVVLDDEDDGEREERGEVEGLVDVAGAGPAVAEEREADGGAAEAALGIGHAGDVAQHRAEVADHRERTRGGVAVMDVALAGFRGAGGVGEVLVEVVTEVAAPNQVAAKAAVRKGNDIGGFVGEEGEGNDESLVALAAGDGALDEALTEEIEDAVVAGAGDVHPGVNAEEGGHRIAGELGGREFAGSEVRGRRRKRHEALARN